MKERYWQQEIETAPVEKLRDIQEEKAKVLVKRAYEKTAFYRQKFDTAGVKPGDIHNLEDFHSLPLTEYMKDFVNTPMEQKLAVPLEDVVGYFSTSGTVSGSPQPIALSRKDAEIWQDIFSRFACLWGLGKDDIYHMPLFPFKIVELGIEAAGVKVIPVTHVTSFIDNAIKLMRNVKATAILTSPSLFLVLTSRAKELGIEVKEIGIKKAVLGGESWADAYRRRMQQEWNMEFYDIYGMVEVGHPLGECTERNGMHCWDDLFILEIIDPETGKVLGSEEYGEIVITSLWREATPLIRYRTGDIAKLLAYKPCSCGRTFSKFSRVRGRVSQLIKAGRTRLLPIDVEDALLNLPELSGEYQIILSPSDVQDILEVKAECNIAIEVTPSLQNKIEAELEKVIQAKSKVELIPFGQFPKGLKTKAERVVKKGL